MDLYQFFFILLAHSVHLPIFSAELVLDISDLDLRETGISETDVTSFFEHIITRLDALDATLDQLEDKIDNSGRTLDNALDEVKVLDYDYLNF